MSKDGLEKGTVFPLEGKAFFLVQACPPRRLWGSFRRVLLESKQLLAECQSIFLGYFWEVYLTLRIVFKVFLDDSDKRIRIDAEFMIAYAVDSGEGFLGNGFDPGHFS